LTFRQDVLKKNLEIVKLQDAQKGKESRSVTESFSLSPRRRTPSPERKGVQDSSKDFNVEGLLGLQNAEEKKEIESLRSKLKSVSEIFQRSNACSVMNSIYLYNSCPTNHDPSATLHELDANIVVCL
jgi:seryl-tRNA synthetase